LGSCITVSLAEARERALECRKLRESGIDPIDAREAARRQVALERAKSIKFKDAAATYMAAHRGAWKNDKHAAQWVSTLQTYAYPLLGDVSMQAIDTALVMKVIEPIWAEKPETANRLRGRIESILDWATVRGYREGENPARWRGHLDKLLPSRAKVRKTQHHSALAYAELPAFMTVLRQQDGVAARALEFTILTAARTSETLGSRRSEFDYRQKLWAVPAERMKAGKEHRSVELQNDRDCRLCVPLARFVVKLTGSGLRALSTATNRFAAIVGDSFGAIRRAFMLELWTGGSRISPAWTRCT